MFSPVESMAFLEANSLNRLQHLFGRFEQNAQAFYASFSLAEAEIDNCDIEVFENPIDAKGHLSLWEYNL